MAGTYFIAVVEPDQARGRSLRALLEAERFRVESFDNAAAAMPALHNGVFDLCLLSLDLPNVDGIELCRSMRLSGVSAPVIGVTARFEEARRIDALAAGADDVVPRDISARELIARARSVLRRNGNGSGGASFEDGELKVLLDQMRAVVNGRTVPFARGEARVLSILIHEAPAPVSSARLRLELIAMGERDLKATTIEARIKSLRRKLGRHRIETRARYGYAFVMS